MKMFLFSLFAAVLFNGFIAFHHYISADIPAVVKKEPIKPWVYVPTKNEVKVVTPSQVSLANHFGPRVYSYAQTIRDVNGSNTFPSNRLLLAIAATESSFREGAQSSSSVGLMQINYSANELNKQDLFDVKTNVKHSIRILKTLNKQCDGNLKCVLLSYNVGNKAYREGRYNPEYYNKVLKYYNM